MPRAWRVEPGGGLHPRGSTPASGAQGRPSGASRFRRSRLPFGAITARRKYNAPQRRRQLADVAIHLLGTDGPRGLSHPRVDKAAQLPTGTSSYYFRTRKALLRAAAERLTELDVADLSMMAELGDDGSAGYHGTLGLARLVIKSRSEPWLTRTRARYQLALEAQRDPDLAPTMLEFGLRFYGMARDVVARWNGDDPPEGLVDEQAVVMLTLINGVMMSFVHGYPVTSDAAHLDRLIQDVLRGVALGRGEDARGG